jgi:uncharacterized protein (TIGR02466 family)
MTPQTDQQINLKITPLFANLFAETVLTGVDNDAILDYCLRQPMEHPGRQFSNHGGWQSEDFFKPPAQLETLCEKIQQAVDETAKHLGIHDSHKLGVGNFWINVNYPGSLNMSHIHSKSDVSGCYYVNVPDNSGSIVFNNPIQVHSWCFSSSMIKTKNTFNSSDYSRMPAAGSLFLFPSWLMHSVTPNKSNQPRVSIAFNAAFFKVRQ